MNELHACLGDTPIGLLWKEGGEVSVPTGKLA